MMYIKVLFGAMIAGCLSVANAYALDLLKPLAQLSAQDILHAGPSSEFFSLYDKGIEGECSPLLDLVRVQLQSPDTDKRYSAQIVMGEMFDRAVCVPYSPKKAFKHFKKAAEGGGSVFYAHVGWKYIHGHGVAKSETNAHEAYKKLLTRDGYFNSISLFERYQDILSDRPMPQALINGINWIVEIKSTKDGPIKLAQALRDGSGQYYDGGSFDKDLPAAKNILRELIDRKNSQAMFMLSLILLEEETDKSLGEAQMLMLKAANCGFPDAAIKLAEFYQNGSFDYTQSELNAYGWYDVAKSLGADVKKNIEVLERKLFDWEIKSVRKDHPWLYSPKTCLTKK